MTYFVYRDKALKLMLLLILICFFPRDMASLLKTIKCVKKHSSMTTSVT